MRKSNTLKNSSPFSHATIKTSKEKGQKTQRVLQPLCLVENIRMMSISYH